MNWVSIFLLMILDFLMILENSFKLCFFFLIFHDANIPAMTKILKIIKKIKTKWNINLHVEPMTRSMQIFRWKDLSDCTSNFSMIVEKFYDNISLEMRLFIAKSWRETLVRIHYVINFCYLSEVIKLISCIINSIQEFLNDLRPTILEN